MTHLTRLLLLSLVIGLMTSSAQAQTPATGSQVAAPAARTAGQTPSLASFIKSLQPSNSAVSQSKRSPFVKTKHGKLTLSPLQGKAACDEYTIDCGNGTGDSCCGSYSSCVSYCEEFCAVDYCS